MAILLWIMHSFNVILLYYFKQKCGLTNLHLICKNIQVREKRAEFVLLKCTFVRRASEFLRNYFPSLIDSMLNDKGNFSERGHLQRPDHADMRYKCRTYARLLQHIKVFA